MENTNSYTYHTILRDPRVSIRSFFSFTAFPTVVSTWRLFPSQDPLKQWVFPFKGILAFDSTGTDPPTSRSSFMTYGSDCCVIMRT